MAIHDVRCTQEGWEHLIDGVRAASFATWAMAINAARSAAESDVRFGRPASLRYQGPDGEMRPMPTRATQTAFDRASVRPEGAPADQPSLSH
jgi:hypothetical protein